MIIEPEQDIALHFEMSETERAIVAAYVVQDGWKLIKKLIEQEIRLLTVHLMNTPDDQTETVISRFKLAKSAAMVYKGLCARLEENSSVQQIKSLGIGTVGNPEKPQFIEEFE
jgi:hypothetical protein